MGAMMELLRPPQQLAIEQSDSTIMMGVDLGPARPLYFNGRATVDTLSDMSARSSQAKWKGNKLEVERTIQGAPGKLTESYWIDAEHGGVLVVDVKVDGLPRKIEIHRVYQPVKPSN